MTKEVKKIINPIYSLALGTSPFHIEINKSAGGYSIISSGIKRIAELSENEIKLKCRDGEIKLKGQKLSLTVYENKTVEIIGKIEVIEFGNTKT